MAEWKLCPFCGSAMQVFLYSSAWGDRYFPACTNENCLLNRLAYIYKPEYQTGYKSKGSANVAANTRPIEDALRQRIAELEAQIELVRRTSIRALFDDAETIEALEKKIMEYEPGFDIGAVINKVESDKHKPDINLIKKSKPCGGTDAIIDPKPQRWEKG